MRIDSRRFHGEFCPKSATQRWRTRLLSLFARAVPHRASTLTAPFGFPIVFPFAHRRYRPHGHVIPFDAAWPLANRRWRADQPVAASRHATSCELPKMVSRLRSRWLLRFLRVLPLTIAPILLMRRSSEQIPVAPFRRDKIGVDHDNGAPIELRICCAVCRIAFFSFW